MTNDARPHVVFLCVHNAGRSQMALGWFEHLARSRAVAYAGGSQPADRVNPTAIAAMSEIGIDIASYSPKRWSDEMLEAADVVVTMGCGDACPYVPGTRFEDWAMPDPADLGLDEVRPIRDEIRRRVRSLLAELGVHPSPRRAAAEPFTSPRRTAHDVHPIRLYEIERTP